MMIRRIAFLPLLFATRILTAQEPLQPYDASGRYRTGGIEAQVSGALLAEVRDERFAREEVEGRRVAAADRVERLLRILRIRGVVDPVDQRALLVGLAAHHAEAEAVTLHLLPEPKADIVATDTSDPAMNAEIAHAQFAGADGDVAELVFVLR